MAAESQIIKWGGNFEVWGVDVLLPECSVLKALTLYLRNGSVTGVSLCHCSLCRCVR